MMKKKKLINFKMKVGDLDKLSVKELQTIEDEVWEVFSMIKVMRQYKELDKEIGWDL